MYSVCCKVVIGPLGRVIYVLWRPCDIMNMFQCLIKVLLLFFAPRYSIPEGEEILKSKQVRLQRRLSVVKVLWKEGDRIFPLESH